MADVRSALAIAGDPRSVKRNIDNANQQVCIGWEAKATGTTESALVNATFINENGVALAAADHYTVPTGKTLRITFVSAAFITSPAVNRARIRIRQAGTVANTSPIIWQGYIGLVTAPAVNSGANQDYTIPDGIDVPASQQITVTTIAAVAGSSTMDIVIVGYLY